MLFLCSLHCTTRTDTNIKSNQAAHKSETMKSHQFTALSKAVSFAERQSLLAHNIKLFPRPHVLSLQRTVMSCMNI